jgi:hydroxymethylpyrimidine pyrophosphatase-like HAD family hydrolase
LKIQLGISLYFLAGRYKINKVLSYISIYRDFMPKKKKAIDIKKVEELAALGLSKQEIIYCLDMDQSTYYRNQKDSPELQVAYERGRAKGVMAVTQKLIKHHINKDNNFEAARFYLKTRSDNYKEKSEIKHTGDKDNPVEVKTTHVNPNNIPALTAEADEILAIARQRKAARESKPEILPTDQDA